MRGKPAPKRDILPDPKFSSVTLAKFINKIMQRGKKSVAEKVVYRAFDEIQKKTGKDPLQVFDNAVKNVSPILEVRSRRIGGANYQVPVEVRPDRRTALAFRWLINAANSKKGKPTHLKLAAELLDASNKVGDAMKKREDVHRMAEANRAFAHFA